MRLLVTLDGARAIENLSPTLALILLFVNSLVVLIGRFPVRYMGAVGTGITKTTSLSLIGILTGVGEGEVMNRDNLHSAVVEGGVEVALVVVITTFYGQATDTGDDGGVGTDVRYVSRL